MKVRPFLLLGLLWAVSAVAQGTYLYEWQGDSGLFRASFQIHEGTIWLDGDPLFGQTVNVTSPDRSITGNAWWTVDWDYYYQTPPRFASLGFVDSLPEDTAQREILFMTDWSEGWAMVHEWDTVSQKYLWSEWGHWTITYVPAPEPSTASLIGLAGVLWLIKSKRA